MKKINLFVFIIVCNAYFVLALDMKKGYCFQYTWVASKTNCSEKKVVPCIEPIIIEDTPVNSSMIWENERNKNETERLCNLTSSNVCLKHTYKLNNNMVNSSMYCGKLIVDDIGAVTSGCYEQKVGGYNLEVCACQSRTGREPCNAATGVNHFVILIVISLLFVITNYYN